MYIKKINLINFRNYKKLTVSFNKGINIIYGENAQGKTNLLESIYVLGITKSHRNIQETNLITNGEKSLLIKGILKKDKLNNELEIYIDNYKKILKNDKSVVKKVSDYISNMNIILFTPDDLDIVKGSPQNRRKFLNTELSQLYSNYYIVLNEYEKLLKIRNDYLKNTNKGIKFDKDYFDILTQYLVDKSILIYRMRKKFVDKLNLYVDNIFYNITGKKNFKIVYKNSMDLDLQDVNLKQKILEKYQEKYDVELKLTSTLYGPHKDDIEFYLDDLNIKNYGSQGQQRIAVLSLKLAEIEIFKNYVNSTPILLLDDIFSEIDDIKKNNLLTYISKDVQTIITTTDLNSLDNNIIKNAKLLNIKNGRIKKVNEVI